MLIIERMLTIIRGLWVLSVLGAVAALYVVMFHIVRADTSEQQAHCAAVAIAVALAPYCLARGVEEAARKRNI